MTPAELAAVPEASKEPAGDPILALMRRKRTEIKEGKHKDLIVGDRSDGPNKIWVRYGALDFTEMQPLLSSIEKATGENGAQTVLNANADLLVMACKGVFATVDGKIRGLDPKDAEWPTFKDQRLPALLGLGEEQVTARSVCIELLGEADVLGHADKVTELSGLMNADVMERLAGE